MDAFDLAQDMADRLDAMDRQLDDLELEVESARLEAEAELATRKAAEWPGGGGVVTYLLWRLLQSK